MTIFLSIVFSILTYAFIGAFVGSKHYAITGPSCHYFPKSCWGSRWCRHATFSFWVGAGWFVMLPVTAGIFLGANSKAKRDLARQARELAEADHKRELARLARMEDEELTRQLHAQAKQRSLQR